MDTSKICMIGIICVFLSQLLKENKGDLSFAVKIACCIFVFVSAVSTLLPVLEFARNTLGTSALASYAEILFKSLGIAYATSISSDICRDCGESAVASNIELAGKAEMILLSLPALKEIITLAGEMMS